MCKFLLGTCVGFVAGFVFLVSYEIRDPEWTYESLLRSIKHAESKRDHK